MDDIISRKKAMNIRFSRGINEDGLLFVPYRDVKAHLESLPPAELGTNLAEVGADVPDTNVGDTISRQAAVNYCKKMLIETALNNVGFICNADELLLDIEENRIETWLSHVPPAQPELCEDAVSRQAAIDALDVLCQEHRYKIPGKAETYSEYNEAWQDALDRAEGAIGNLQPVQLELCEDAVSRAWLLAEYDRQHQGPPGGARKIIETAPPVTPKQRLIPCSERLPAVKQKVLVQHADGSMATCRCNDAGHLQWFYSSAVAWMPAPEPYQPQKEVTE